MRYPTRMDKDSWYRHGGFSNPTLFRKVTKSGAWTYWRV